MLEAKGTTVVPSEAGENIGGGHEEAHESMTAEVPPNRALNVRFFGGLCI